ncbi:MAG: M15 family metallopeptidase [Candidatus Eremiobacteraeota bacterium]|nr:M15 family metallopeptidase [Candidatus Eremiobacteraeota bacterium]
MKIPDNLAQALLGSLLLATCCGTPTLAEAPSQLVELTKIDPTLRLDIRYASNRNFMGFPLYSEPRAFLQKDAAEALRKVNDELHAQGLGLLILDAYRPWSVTKLMWDKTPPSKRDYVADPQKGSRHNRGAAVDLTIVDMQSGKPIAMPSSYDDFSQKAHHSYQGGSELARSNRAKLRELMEKHGFEALSNEWWHYDYQGWQNYPIMDKKFEEI